MKKKNPSTKKYHIKRIVHWYFGNYYAIKCHDAEEQLFDCQQKLEEFGDKFNDYLAYQEFLGILENRLAICKLPKEQRRKYIAWKTFAKTTNPMTTVTHVPQNIVLSKQEVVTMKTSQMEQSAV